jgi:hypothetical protein
MRPGFWLFLALKIEVQISPFWGIVFLGFMAFLSYYGVFIHVCHGFLEFSDWEYTGG